MASVKVLGRFKASSETGDSAIFRTVRAAEVVALLALQPHAKMRRSTMAQELWPESGPSEQLKNLRPALHYAKAAMGSGVVFSEEEKSETLVLSASSDWQEAKLLDFKAASQEEPDTKLMMLINLAEVVRKPFLEFWDREWIDQYRVRHTKLQFRVLHSLAEELAQRGELATAIEYASHLSETDPLNESVVRLQLRLLGQTDRLAEAQRTYSEFRNRLKETLDIDVSPELKAIAQKAIAGGYAQKHGSFVPTVQLEMVQSLLTMLAEASPERLLPLLAAPEVNWAIVTHGREIRRILETVIEKTEGWDPDRAGVVKRLMQYYNQEGEYQHLRRLSHQLLGSPRKIDRIPALSYLAMIAVAEGQKEQAMDLYDQTERIATEEDLPYLLAVTRANIAITHLAFADFELAKRGLESCLDALSQRTEPNARYSASRAMVALAQTYHFLNQSAKADEAIENWFAMGVSDEVIRQDSTGLAFLGMIKARSQDPAALDWCAQAIELAVKSRRRTEMKETTFFVCRALVLLGHAEPALEAAQSLHYWILENRGELVPLERIMLEQAGVYDFSPSLVSASSLTKIIFGLRDAIELQA
jgi:DNA-binding SARP family transcriptional activator